VDYTITIRPTAGRALKKLVENDRDRIARAIQALGSGPRPDRCRKMRGSHNPPRYRIRVGDYRVIYTIDDAVKAVTVVLIGHRSDIYRR
jgi:mRNA interferase RelE/StbE